MHVYESFCTPLCRKYQLNQSDLDLILFIANNPMYNTAKDVCEIRGIKKGIVSVTTERLVQSGYLIRKMTFMIEGSNGYASRKNASLS